MYLIEILIKKFKNSDKKKIFFFNDPAQEDKAFKNCDSHIYLPIDSAKEHLACKNCGHIIKNPEK